MSQASTFSLASFGSCISSGLRRHRVARGAVVLSVPAYIRMHGPREEGTARGSAKGRSMLPKTVKKLRITGPGGAAYRLGDPLLVFDEDVLVCTVDPLPVSPSGDEILVEHFTPALMSLEESRHLSRLVFLEICAFVAETIHEVRAVTFAFSRPARLLSNPSADRVEIMHRIGIENVQVSPRPAAMPGHFVVSGTWHYSDRNLTALNEVLAELRVLYRNRPIGTDPDGGARVIKRLVARWRRQ